MFNGNANWIGRIMASGGADGTVLFSASESGGTVTLTFQPGAGTDGFTVHRSGTPGFAPSVLVHTSNTAAGSWQDEPGPGTWYYQVRGTVAGVEAGVSNIATVTVPEPEPEPAATLAFDYEFDFELS